MKKNINKYLKWKYLKRFLASPRNLILRKFALPTEILSFNFEVTRKCSGKCLYCSIWRDKPSDEISIDEVRKGLNPKSLFKNVEVIEITGGEPFLRKDFVELCHALKEICPRATLGLVTNGLHPKLVLSKIKEIQKFDPKVSIGVSIDGFAHSDGILRGNPKHSDLAWETIRQLQKEGFDVGVGSVVTRLNINEMMEFRRFCLEEKGVRHAVMSANYSEFFYSNIEQEGAQELLLTNKEYSLLKDICLSGDITPANYYLPEYLARKRQIFPCFSGFSSFFLNSNGTVYPCIQLNKPLGNIRNQSFGEFWEIRKVKKIRESIMRNKCHCYTRCEVQAWLRANIFPAVMFAITQFLRKFRKC